MPEFPGRLRTPRLPAPPSAPAVGEMYYNTATNKLFWWNGTTWIDATGGAGAGGGTEVNVSTAGPSPRVGELLWVDTDEPYVAGPPTVVTSMPTTPYEGQEVYYVADATNGVMWRFRYRGASPSPYKWEFVGGSDILTEMYQSGELQALLQKAGQGAATQS